MNTTTLIGRLAQDPELRFTTGGTSVATFRLAVPNPQDDDQPNWIPIKALGKTADAVAEYLTKGNQVAVTGRLGVPDEARRRTGDARCRCRPPAAAPLAR